MSAVFRHLLALLLLWACVPAGAAITCTSVTSSGVSIIYTSGTTANSQGTFTVTCTRALTTDPTSIAYDVGVNKANTNTATNAASTLTYELNSGSACANSGRWKASPAGSRIADTITWAAGSTGPLTKQTSYWACMASQVPPASGVYTDTVTMTVYVGGSATTTIGNFPFSIYVNPYCAMTSRPSPSTLLLDYVALGPQVSASATFSVQCTLNIPYTLTTNVTEGVLNNLRYILSVSTGNSVGSGVPKSHSVTATIPAGQAGTCAGASCNSQAAHTVVVTY